ncbi:diguanylate cyclase/phosphodiesterase with GAF sensor [Chromohalobacter marismortui]|uniref:Diguanylate cyclase/phosphodiesterase with GAF sensor n=1 Tax=Chromohalobacter marismortui TaxID=42055 RepID=A0A4R7NT04_9GAMM|nr:MULTISPECIES: GGDEF domain-containing protein [Chromohalobacter]MCI0509275.1 GGDEF domain-containing protein [Chromohalobacter sp.]MCI0594520.1 GGDEF domain-containing protein [Chromohalobacter sp.]TDU23832.1 diguanylate cyclase/phosphodiesterase with GAF sensor [Chromohalobacter marismortui]
MTPKRHEQRRLHALLETGLLDTPPEERFDRLTRIAKQHYQVNTALFTLIDAKRQWFKSKQNLGLEETPRRHAFCDYTIQQSSIYVVEDAANDLLFSRNPLVTGTPHIRFYAGIPVRDPTGFNIGTLCMIDSRPRDASRMDFSILRSLAAMLEEELERVCADADAHYDVYTQKMAHAIQRVQDAFSSSEERSVACEALLSELLHLTGSQIGFVGEINDKAHTTPHLYRTALSGISRRQPSSITDDPNAKNGIPIDKLDDLLGLPLRTRHTVTRTFEAPLKLPPLFPDHYPGIHTYMGIPLHAGEEQIGLIGIANRSEGYPPSLITLLSPLLQTVETLFERERLNATDQEKKRLLNEAVNIDGLTGLPSRRLLNELFQDELVAARHRRGSISVCFLDLDGFKAINDRHGHAVGDDVLKCVADRLRSAVRHHDVIARLGGDEFVVILRDVDHPRTYRHILDQLRHPMPLQGNVIELSASMGITRFPSDDSDSDLLLRHADQAMYTAKESGKNCYHFFDIESHHSQQERFAIGEQVQHALDEGQLELFYQPKLHYKTGHVSGFEGLIRWHHPSGKLVYPGRFLPYIEHTKLDIELGKHVISQAVSTLETFRARNLPYTVSINLSPSHFLNDEFLDHLNNTLSRYDMAFRKRLTLEILESTALDDAGLAASNIKACQALGVELSLDDFGTGFSSLSYLRKFSTNEIKIDRSFILGMLDDPEDEMIVEAIIALSKSFNRRVIAEGVEHRATEEKLIDMGCDMGQGFLYSPALPLDEALDWASCHARP